MDSFFCHRRTKRASAAVLVLSALLLLLLLGADAALQHPTSSSTSHRTSREILDGLQSSRPSPPSSRRLLDLETDFYDAGTGLHSEGVWHNCMAGIAALQLSSRARNGNGVILLSWRERVRRRDDAARIADSLFRHSWDGTSFRRRAWSGDWDHSRRMMSEDTDVVQPNYYGESSEHRCVQHAIALAFWSMLARDVDVDVEGETNDDVRSRQSLIARQFVDEFWNGRRWTTVGRSQGSGTTLRPSASGGGGTIAGTDEEGGPYFRAVDQAVAVLACLEHVRLLEDDAVVSANDAKSVGEEKKQFEHIIRTTCRDLLDCDEGFGYDDPADARTYLGLDRNRNFWHEGWVMLALSAAARDDCDYVWPMDAREGRLRILWEGLVERYTVADTASGRGADDVSGIWHWPPSTKEVRSNVRYCGDNALAYAIRRDLRCCRSTEGGSGKDNDGDADDDDTFWSFVDMLRSGSEEGGDGDNPYNLASVADAYPQVRLHPNTELAALLVWPS